MRTESGARIAVAGAGVFGLASALALARAGMAVTVFDPAMPGDNASGVAAGMLAPASEALFDAASAPHLALLRKALDLWPTFVEGLDVDIQQADVRIEGEADWLSEICARGQVLGLPQRREPEGALLLAGDQRLDAPGALAAFRTAAGALGVVFEMASVTGFERGALTLSDGRAEGFDVLVLATGASLREGAMAPETAALTPIKGQILRLEPGPAAGPVVRGLGVYLCPGTPLKVGATMEFGRDDLSPDPAKADQLLQAATALRPALATSTAEIQVGVRASTPDGLPLVGWSARSGIMLAVGARRNGWLLAPLVAGLVAAYLTDKDPGQEAAQLDARRFHHELEA